MADTQRRLAAITTATLLFLAMTAEHASPGTGPFRRVRALDPQVSFMLATGHRRSPTFRALVDALEQSDVIVHVERRTVGSEAAFMTFVTHAGGTRYLRIALDTELAPYMAIALLGHELQHAVEVAMARWVIDLATFSELYRAIGHTSCPEPRHCFDTASAVDAGRRVLHELHAERTAAAD